MLVATAAALVAIPIVIPLIVVISLIVVVCSNGPRQHESETQ
jgi:hypothetical protein